ETPGKSGLAHFLEHLMFKGTSRHPVGEFSQTVLKVGGNENASTSVDYTGYFQRVPREQLGKMMEFEADRMTGLILKDENVRPEPVPVAPRTVTLADPHVEQPTVKRDYLVPSAATAAAGESPALDVLAQLMGNGSNSYLYRALVVDKPLAVNANANYQGTSLD